ncbi:MAG TPA: winged helix-turn-helix domain-containing protein [Usitatibacter sp.]|nr:winged helix-turn-helix domain-containing protein [Usitatibacter sp.]
MADPAAPPKTLAEHYRFGPFRLDGATRALYRGDEFTPLTPKAADILLLLVQEAGRVVTKEQILGRVWPGLVIEEGVIANNISALRKVLDGDFDGDGPIATVSRRGYRFTAKVSGAEERAATPATHPSTPAPPICERDMILVADIENRTGDALFDGTMREALLLHLAQSPFVEILTDRKMLSILGYMGKRGAAITGEIALEICVRTGSKCAITGSIFEVGGEYRIGLQAVRGDTGELLVSEQASAHGKAEVLKALDRAAMGLRTKLGESLASVNQFSRAFEELATASLDALKAYTTGRNEWVNHGETAGKPHLLRAVQLDPRFASPYGALAFACSNMGQVEEAEQYMRKAYDLRDSLPEGERIRIMASYHLLVTGDLFKAIDSHRVWQDAAPRDSAAFGNMGNLLMIAGHWDKALALAQRAYTLEPTAVSGSNLAIAMMAVGRHVEARAILEDGLARGFNAFYLHLDAYHEAFLRGDTEAMRRHAEAVSGREGEEDFLLAAQADTEAFSGRFERARALSHRAIDSARRAGSLEMAAMWAGQAALREAEIGVARRAREGAIAALDLSAGRDVNGLAALALARAGELARSGELAQALDRDHPNHTIVQRLWIPCIRAALALAEHDWDAAVEILEPALRVELGITSPFEGCFMTAPYLRGLALLGSGRGSDATREFAKIIERPGLIKNFVLFPLAHLAASKAAALEGSSAEAALLKEKFDAMWQSADVAVA